MHRAIPRAAARLGATLRSSGASGSGRCSSCASGAPRTLAPLHAQRCTPLAQRPQPPLQQQQPHRRGISASAAAAAPEGGPAAAAAPAAAGSSSARPAPPLAQSRFCRQCGSPMEVIRPEGDGEWRHVCTSCSYVDYFNPKMVVGCIVEHDGKLLLCRRAIEPCRGKWTVPAGFMELAESTMGGAARETWEETGAKVEIISPFMHLDIPAIGQSYLLFRARLAPPFTFAAGGTAESLESRLFDPAEIPDLAAAGQIAFSSVDVALRKFCDDLAAGRSSYHHGTIRKTPGSAPNDPSSFELVDHYAFDLAAK